jgi:cathepsin A (carboxypeptidase C)
MDWYGKEDYNLAKTEPWFSDLTGKKAGEVRNYDKLTFLRIYDAGHMVCDI